MKRLFFLLVLMMAGCVSLPEGVTPVDNFQLERYLGTWYEITRLDHSFERGLSRVTAEYSRRPDGGVRVVNRGYSEKENSWQEAEGRAYFVQSPDRGYLKVSFFGPFFGSYVIFALDHDHYQYALVCGPDRSYLWILSRTPDLSPEIVRRLVKKASDTGFDTDRLIFVEH